MSSDDRRPARPQEQGAALVMALFLVVAVGTLTTVMTGNARLTATETVGDRAAMQALQAADGGIEQARVRLRDDPAFDGEVVRIGCCDVAIAVASEQPGRWTVTSTASDARYPGDARAVRRTVVAELRATDGLPARRSWREAGTSR